jgi:radical SAM-linked protein
MLRVLLSIRKGEGVKYLSHRDVIRSFEYALRRARIPVAFSEGFNPRPKMSFGGAIGVGVTSDDEKIQLDLSSPLTPAEVMEKLNAVLPEEIRILAAEECPEGRKSPLSRLNASEFRLDFLCGEGCSPEDVKNAVDRLLASSEVKIVRVREGKAKNLDLRPFLLSADAAIEGENIRINVALRAGDNGGAGPRDFVQALGEIVPNLSVKSTHRIRQFDAGRGNEATEPLSHDQSFEA